MALLAAEAVEAEMGAAGGSAESTFTQDSAENAAAQGVDLKGVAKDLSTGLSLVMAILNLVRSERRGADETAERADNRHRVGIVFSPEESRLALNRDGKLPAYYSSSNIRRLLSANKLPYGWSEETALKQGFGTEIRAGEFRRRNREQMRNMIDRNDEKLAVGKQLAQFDALNRRFRLNRALQSLKIS